LQLFWHFFMDFGGFFLHFLTILVILHFFWSARPAQLVSGGDGDGDGGGGGGGGNDVGSDPHWLQVFLQFRNLLSRYLSQSFFLHFCPSLSVHADGLGGGGGNDDHGEGGGNNDGEGGGNDDGKGVGGEGEGDATGTGGEGEGDATGTGGEGEGDATGTGGEGSGDATGTGGGGEGGSGEGGGGGGEGGEGDGRLRSHQPSHGHVLCAEPVTTRLCKASRNATLRPILQLH
jgi:hypothetical protein